MSKMMIIEMVVNGVAALAVSLVLIGMLSSVKRMCKNFLKRGVSLS